MPIKIGEVEALFRYPVKSMSGEPLDVADLGWHGLDGDRRLAFRRVDDRGGFPWLTASRPPELLPFFPQRRGPAGGGGLPTHARTPEGQEHLRDHLRDGWRNQQAGGTAPGRP